MWLSVLEGDRRRRVHFEGQQVRVGRAADNDLVLSDARISSHHLEFRRTVDGWRVRDLGSRNGSSLAGRPLLREAPFEGGMELRLGSCVLRMEEGEDLDALRRGLHAELIERLDPRRGDLDSLRPEELRQRAVRVGEAILASREEAGALPRGVKRDALLRELLDEALGLGPLEPLLADEAVTEILVNRPDRVWVEREGRLQQSACRFSSESALLQVIERIVAPLGRRIDESSPTVDARLPDGSRVHAIIPPLSLQGPCLTIRKFRRIPLGVEELVACGSLSEKMARFLELCVSRRKNVIISGGTGSGKTTLLNLLTSFVPDGERIITVEDAAELQVRKPHWVQLEARPANLEGRGAIGIRELVRNCLRMRPDRIVVGECRGGEALDMLQAMNTGHDGSLTTLHANGPRDALMRLETLCLMSGIELPIRAIREQIARAVDVVVQQTRFADGSRRITHIAEVTGMESEAITLQDVFSFEVDGYDADGRVRGRHLATGFVPRFVEAERAQGRKVDLSLFGEAA